LGTWRILWRVMMHPSWERNWIIPSPITLLVAKFLHEYFSPWTEVYENIFLSELICCEHSELIIHLSSLSTNLFVTARTSHLSSSTSANSVTLASYYFLLASPIIRSNVPLLVTPVAYQILVFWVTLGTSIITLLLYKVTVPKIIAMRLARQLIVNFVLIK